ncbi:SBBP repeat-containing protein [Parapedomonas caeni]
MTNNYSINYAALMSTVSLSSSAATSYTPIQMDLSGLITNVNPAPVVSQKTLSKFDTPAVIAPWNDSDGSSSASLYQAAQSALALDSFINLKSDAVGKAEGDADLKTLFGLYQALDNLKALAAYGAEKTTPSTALAQLSAKFAEGLAEVQKFTATSATDKLALMFGTKKSQLETVTLPKTATKIEGIGIVEEDPTKALSGLTGAESFTIRLSSSTKDETFTIDLSQITTTLSLGAVVGLINQQISASVVLDSNGDPLLSGDGEPMSRFRTRAELYKTGDDMWGIRFAGSSTETITLGDPAVTEPSIYVLSQNSSSGNPTIGGLRRLDDIDNTLTLGNASTVAGLDTGATALAAAVYKSGKTSDGEGAPGDIAATTTARNMAVDSQGFLYVVGTSSGDFGIAKGDGENDLFLTKYAPDGKVIYSRLVGGGGVNEGYAVAVDKDDNVIVAGSTTGNLAPNDAFNGQDAFVTKFTSDGTELFTTQIDRVAVNAGTALTTDADGNIYLAGTVTGTISPTDAAVGGQDVFVAKIDGAKRVVEGVTSRVMSITQFGTTGADSVADIAVGADGAVLVATTESGRAIVRKLDSADLDAQLGQIDLGAVGSGGLTGIAVDPDTGTVVVVGSTTSGSLDAGPATGSPAGFMDGFVARLDGALTAQGVTYIGTDQGDRISDVAIRDGNIYVSGSTTGVLAGSGRKGSVDSFVSRLDLGSGAVEATAQYGAVETATAGVALALNTQGYSSTLARLGLTAGVQNPAQSSDLLSQTSLRKGDYFYISVDGGTKRKITIREGDTLKSLSVRIKAISSSLDVSVSTLSTGTKLQIKVKGDATVDVLAGDNGRDALAKLGMEPTKLLSAERLYGLGGEDEMETLLTPGGSYALGLTSALTFDDKRSASYVLSQISNAMSTIQRAYRSLYYDETRVQLAQNAKYAGSGSAPAYLTKQLANYQDALSRLGGGVSSSTLI